MSDLPRVPLILVTGCSGSGKTTLARLLAAELDLPLLARDALKETLMGALGAPDRDASRRIGGASWALFHQVLGELAGRTPMIAEANFRPGTDEDRLRAVTDRAATVIVHCQTDVETIRLRVEARRDDPTRHPGHHDAAAWPELASALAAGAAEPLRLSAPLVVVDTTDGYRPTVPALLRDLRLRIGRDGP